MQFRHIQSWCELDSQYNRFRLLDTLDLNTRNPRWLAGSVRAQQALVLCSLEKMKDFSVRYSIYAQQVGQWLLTMYVSSAGWQPAERVIVLLHIPLWTSGMGGWSAGCLRSSELTFISKVRCRCLLTFPCVIDVLLCLGVLFVPGWMNWIKLPGETKWLAD